MKKQTILNAALAVIALELSAAAQAGQTRISCTEELIGQEAAAGKTATHSLVIADGDPASATIDGRFGSHKLSASLVRDPQMPSMFGAHLYGTVRGPMPNKADMDTCIATGRAQNPTLFGDGDMDEMLAQGCREKVRFNEVPISLNIRMTIETDGVADVFVERKYEGDDERGQALFGITSFTEWTCSLVK